MSAENTRNRISKTQKKNAEADTESTHNMGDNKKSQVVKKCIVSIELSCCVWQWQESKNIGCMRQRSPPTTIRL